MARKSKYSDKQWEAALKIYRTQGRAQANRQTGIPASTIGERAKRDGIETEVENRAIKAQQIRRAQNAAKQEEIKQRLLDRIIDLDKRIDKKYKTYWGVDAKPVEYNLPPAEAVKAFMMSIGIAIDKYQILTGKQPGLGQNFMFTLDMNAMTGRDETSG